MIVIDTGSDWYDEKLSQNEPETDRRIVKLM